MGSGKIPVFLRAISDDEVCEPVQVKRSLDS